MKQWNERPVARQARSLQCLSNSKYAWVQFLTVRYAVIVFVAFADEIFVTPFEHMQTSLNMSRRWFSKVEAWNLLNFLKMAWLHESSKYVIFRNQNHGPIYHWKWQKKGQVFFFLFLLSSDSFPTNGFSKNPCLSHQRNELFLMPTWRKKLWKAY